MIDTIQKEGFTTSLVKCNKSSGNQEVVTCIDGMHR